VKRRGRIAPLVRAHLRPRRTDPRALALRRRHHGGLDTEARCEVHYTQDLWPFVLLGVLGLFLLDLYAKRVRLFGYRTIKFR
jgi:hypothetical protein